MNMSFGIRKSAAGLLLALAAPLGASEFAPHPIEATLEQCMASPQGLSTQGTRACIDDAAKAWDRELNRIWGELKRELPADAMDRLRAAQRQWIAFRDAEIAALDAAFGAMQGSMFQPMHAEAVSRLTRDRVRQLEALLEAQRVSSQ
jgi:uncharacterized protein YecT (DUF1311 family)